MSTSAAPPDRHAPPGAVQAHGSPRVALACVGIGDVLRGAEQHYLDVYANLKDDLPMTLFQGGRGGPGVRLPRIPRSSPLLRPLSPANRLIAEIVSFAPGLFLALRKGRFDLVNLADIRMAKPRRFLPRWLLPTKFLFTNASEAPAWIAAAFDFVHVTTPTHYEAALAFGIPKERVFLIPHGVDVDRFAPADPESKRRLRERYGILPGAFVVASVGFLGAESHKRPQWVIQEAAASGPGVVLFLAGEQDESTAVVRRMAEEKLGPRAVLTRLPQGEVAQAYHLADLFVLGSLHEAFGIVVIEAMACGLPVVVHDFPSLRWIAGDAGSVVDMAAPGALAREIGFYRDHPDVCRQRGELARRQAVERFSWQTLKPLYLDMFRKCLGLPGRGPR